MKAFNQQTDLVTPFEKERERERQERMENLHFSVSADKSKPENPTGKMIER